MFQKELKIRVRYAETDRMGYAYYGNYATYFEVARVEALRTLGISYKELEDSGVILPVVDFSIKYKKPAYYDDELTINTIIPVIPNVKFLFKYETRNAKGELLNLAQTTLVFVNKSTNKPMSIPPVLKEKIAKYFNAAAL